MGRILLREPFDLVDLLLYLQTLEIVELGLVALEGAIDIVLTLAMRRIFALQGNHRWDELRDSLMPPRDWLASSTSGPNAMTKEHPALHYPAG